MFRFVALAALLAATALWPGSGLAQETKATGVNIGASGLQVPRYVSLKSNRVNVRKGPSTEHAVAWVFSKAGLPVEVIGEFDNWRQIRDSEGTEGWVFHALLSGRRTALVMPWVKEKTAIPLYSDDSTDARTVAQLEPGVLGAVHSCDGKWCNFTVGTYTGWIEQERLWGVYRNEEVE